MTQTWQPRSIYLYLVAFVTLVMIVSGLAVFLNGVAALVLPYRTAYFPTLMDIEMEFVRAGQGPPPLEQLEAIQQARLAAQTPDRSYRLRGLADTLALWLIPIPFYLYAWNLIRRELWPRPRGGEDRP